MTRGRISRQEYLDRSLSRLKPWSVEGISRRTWERRRLRERDASPTQAGSPEQGAGASPADDENARLIEARARVDAIYTQMAEERARRWRWWTQPVEGWREGRLTMRNILHDDTVVVDLRGHGGAT